MKVVQVQYSAKSGGGAAIKLHNAFLEEGVDSYVLTLHYDVNDSDRVIYCGWKAMVTAFIEEKIHEFSLRNSNKEYGLFTYPTLGTDISKNKYIRDADVIYLHWVQKKFLNFTSYRKIAKLGKPVILFMHDMWYITGGCHHSFACEKYRSKCYDCQVFSVNKNNDISARGFKKKVKLYSRFNNFYFISPSKWLKECAEASSLTKMKQTWLIPNFIDRNIFKPIDKKAARMLLGIDNESLVISFGAVSIDSPYKGWQYLRDAFGILRKNFSDDAINILIFGKCNISEMRKMIPFKSVFTGFIKDEYSAAIVYNASDVFVTPSLADNLPTTVLESLSCGTPVVGFRTGGIPDMIEHKVNGYLAEYRNTEDLAEGVKYCLKYKISGKISDKFEKGNIISQHMELLNMLTGKHPNSKTSDGI